MGKKLSKKERAIILSKKILNDFSSGEKIIILLQEASQLARLIEDIENQYWINKEIIGEFNETLDGELMLVNGRYWTIGKKKIYIKDHIEVLETMIETLQIRLKTAIDPNVSLNSSNPNQWISPPIGNKWERDQIVSNVRIYQTIVSKIRGRIFDFTSRTFYSLNFTEIAEDVFSHIRRAIEKKLKIIAPDILMELTTAYEHVSSRKSSNWSNVASGCRRILMRVADLVYPPTGEEIKTKDGSKVKLTKEKYRLRIKQYLISVKSLEGSLVRDTNEYLFEMLDSVDRLNAKGDKNPVNKDVAEKLLIYTYLLLHELLTNLETDEEL